MFCRDCSLLVSYGEEDGFRKTSGSLGPTFFILPLDVPAMDGRLPKAFEIIWISLQFMPFFGKAS